MEYDLEAWTTCPYDPAHRVPRSRIQNHIVKCQKKRPPLSICPYNATHRFPESEMKAHCQNCPQKPLEVEDNRPGGQITVPKPILQREYLPETDPNHECWDD
ncbi:unnamed protein product [Arctia plantaginis]|uniref:CHHC U11-48K-type domain-containing protein n=1 Tax=Arctia plantaginis TaxID=874455 RepID=A0A8S0ZEX0_ARCPL|nr:unnamed protein product [Arctia plantaginis]